MDTLLLSVGYEPIQRISWQNALNLIFDGKAEVVEEYDDKLIRSVRLELPAPAVIRLCQRKPWKRAVKFNRENVYARDRGRCQYCDCRCTRAEFTIDHVVPRAQGGTTRWDNVVICCIPCNQRKADRTPAQAKMPLRSVPRRPAMVDGARVLLTYRPGMPKQWRAWLRDTAYWHGELEHEEEKQ